jgi:flagellar basal body-associated protein FliL
MPQPPDDRPSDELPPPATPDPTTDHAAEPAPATADPPAETQAPAAADGSPQATAPAEPAPAADPERDADPPADPEPPAADPDPPAAEPAAEPPPDAEPTAVPPPDAEPAADAGSTPEAEAAAEAADPQPAGGASRPGDAERADDSPTVEQPKVAEAAGPADVPADDAHTVAPAAVSPAGPSTLPAWAPSPLRDFETPTAQIPVTHDPLPDPVAEPGRGPGELPFLPASPVIPAGDHEPAAGWPVTSPDRPRRRGLRWVAVAVVLALLLCGGGGVSAYLLLRNAEDTDGAPDPTSAVNRFLTAVYTDQNADRAAELVCRESRDAEKLAAKVDEVRTYATTYTGPTFSWNPPTVADEREERAVVTVKLVMTTTDEKTAEQVLTFTTVRRTGWWVCEVSG